MVTDSRVRRFSGTADSDAIVRWNMARDVPAKPLLAPLPRRRVASSRTRVCETHHDALALSTAEGLENTPNVAPVDEAAASLSPSASADLPFFQARRLINNRLETRRQRRHLKESGDYLGVQGVNPETGLLDIITPSDSEGSAESRRARQGLDFVCLSPGQAGHDDIAPSQPEDPEARHLLVQLERDKIIRLQQDKEKLSSMKNIVKWRKCTKQWSSAQEPTLSPVVQSCRSSPTNPGKW